MAGFRCLNSIFHEKHYLSRDNSARFAATRSMRETLGDTKLEIVDNSTITIDFQFQNRFH
jgi:hypothetical protein